MVSMMKHISTLTADIDDLKKVLLSIRITPVTLYREGNIYWTYFSRSCNSDFVQS